MKKSKTFRPVHLLILLAGCINFASAAPYGPEGRQTSWTQPNGQVVQLRVFGDESYARTESPAGFTLVFSDDDNTYYYAKLSADGKSLVSTQVRADEPAPADLIQHIDLPKEQIQEISDANRAKTDGERNIRWSQRVEAVQKIRAAAKGAKLLNADDSKILAAPIVGAQRGLTILVQFPNDPATAGQDPVEFPTTRDKIVRFCNTAGYDEDGNTGSVRDYFFDQSLGALTYTQTVTQVVTLPHPRNYYNYSDYPTNNVIARDIGAKASELIADAITILQDDGFDFSSLTVDASNRAVATNVFFAGPDSGSYARGLWPHQSTIAPTINVGTPSSPIIIANYEITNIPDAAPVIGTFCHENGHLLLGYPDIYALNGEGVGEHCLMGSGNYLNGGRTPSPINGYFKELVGWGNVTDLAPDQFVTAKLPTTGNVAYRILNPNVATEFFMVENRGNGDRWAEFSDDKGIAIWHIDETINGNTGNRAHYGVSLEQADGKKDLENGRNRGDEGDLYDLATPKFADTTDPKARWWDGSKSFVDVEVVSDIGANTTVAFGGVPPNTIIVSSPNGGEVIFKDSTYPLTWKSNISGNVKIDLYKDGVFFVNIAANEVNDGSYDWKVPANLSATGNYTVVISSLTNPVATSDSSDTSFAATNTTFPPNNEMPYGWFKPSSAVSRWVVTKQYHFEGKSSLASGKCGDGQSTAVGYRSTFSAGTVSFYIKVSSEEGFDFAKFYIDGVAQKLAADGIGTGISGNLDWQFVQFPVTAGTHTFLWSYEKDDSYAGLKDSAWIDGVTLPPGKQEITVQQPQGTNLADGKTTKTFPDTPLDTSSKAKTFTIKNTGKAKLTGLAVNKVGQNATEFSVTKLKKTVLSPGESITFDVVFSPKDYGLRTAGLRILSDDVNEGNFAINIQGTGLGVPLIGVNQPSASPMKDGDSRNFGIANVGSEGEKKTFKIINNGGAILNQLKVTKNGANKDDFIVGPLGVITLDPGDSTTFTVTFKPSGANVRNAALHISSNDEKSGPFDILVSGKGSPVSVAAAASNGSGTTASLVEAALGNGSAGSSAGPAASTTVEVIDGQKYLALTVAKLPGGIPAGVVEVSSNLLDWYSGKKHTTVVIDDEATLKVRDNTPVTREAKRYIRLK